MRKRVLVAVSGVAVFGGLFASSAMGAPPDRSDDPFVCPVLTVPEQATGSGQFADLGNGESTILPGNAGSAETFNGNVPSHATNGDGTGSAGGAHSAPGDTDYSAVWSGNQP
jgi:hypothetical protein